MALSVSPPIEKTPVAFGHLVFQKSSSRARVNFWEGGLADATARPISLQNEEASRQYQDALSWAFGIFAQMDTQFDVRPVMQQRDLPRR